MCVLSQSQLYATPDFLREVWIVANYPAPVSSLPQIFILADLQHEMAGPPPLWHQNIYFKICPVSQSVFVVLLSAT